MMEFTWVVFTGVAWVFVALWLAPYFVARHRKHRNATLILVLGILLSLWPILWVNAMTWTMLMGFAWFTAPEKVYVQGPAGPPGPRGRDADEIPLSKSGVLKRG